MTTLGAIKPGQLIELGDGRTAVVRFVGDTAFAQGEWVGVELDDASGKNDGSVQGERYFDCEFKHGMFLRPTAIASILEEPTPKPPKPTAAAKKDVSASKSRLGGALSRTEANIVRRQSAMDPSAAKRQSINAASPTPASRRQTTINGTRLAPKTAGSTATSSTASSRGTTPSLTARKVTGQPPMTSRQGLASVNARTAAKTQSPPPSTAPTGNRSRPSLLGPAAGRARGMPASSTTPRSLAGTASRPSSSFASSDRDGAGSPRKSARKDTSQRPHSNRSAANETDSETNDTESEASHAETTESKHEEQQGQHAQREEASKPESEDERPATYPKKPPVHVQQPRQQLARTTVGGRQVEELEGKLRVLEKKRGEDREKLATLERLQGERDKFEKIIQSLQVKYGPQAKELASLRSKLKDVEGKAEEVDGIKAEHESEMEMATLDREMAEETAEALRAELDSLKQKAEELQLEVEVLREENEELGQEMSPEERTSQGWLQMERTNERMREALLRLRDVSQEQESELKAQIQALEDDLKRLADIEHQYEDAKEQLERSEAAVEDLKEQLEAALSAEDMVEDLTETNNLLNEETSRLRTEVDELQTINELNDEFELQHVENEKQMQEEIDARGASLQEQAARALQQDEKLLDYEYTIVRFRELVANLQGHLEDMKASRQISEAEADELNNSSKAMTDLNMKLQSSAARTQINTIDLEIRRAEAQEATEHLSIIQMFLPDGFKSERKSVLAYLRFKRVAFKSRLLYSLLRETVSNTNSSAFEKVFAYCGIMEQLAWIWIMCERFGRDVGRCSMERFAKYDSSMQDLDPVERTLNGYIDGWKREDFREKLVAEELQRSRSLLEHLSEMHFVSDLATYADEAVARTTFMQINLETAAAALNAAKIILQRSVVVEEESEGESTDGDSASPLVPLIEQINSAIAQSRSAKVVAGKVLTSLTDLRERSMTFDEDSSGAFSEALDLTITFSTQAQSLGESLLQASGAETDDEEYLQAFRTALYDFQTTHFPNLTNPPSPLSGVTSHLRRTLEIITALSRNTANVSQAVEFKIGSAPWVLRAEALKSASASSVATETEITRLRDMMQDRLEQLRVRDLTLEEQKVKIELLESRTKDAGERTRAIEELQRKLENGKGREEELTRALEGIVGEVDGLKRERDRLRRLASEKKLVDNDSAESQSRRLNSAAATSSTQGVETLKLEIRALQGAVRYLRTSNSKPFGLERGTSEDLDWLKAPLFSFGGAEQQASRRDRETLQKEGTNLVGGLIDLTAKAQLVDLTRLPKNMLAWRPAKEKSSWLVACQVEQWESWLAGRERFIRRGREALGVGWQPARGAAHLEHLKAG